MASLILGFIVEQYEYDPFLNMVGYNAVRDAADLLVGNPFEGILAETFLDADAYYYGKYLNDELNLALSRVGETVGIASTLAKLMGAGGAGGSLAAATIKGGTIVVVSGEVALVISGTLILTSGSAIVEAKASQNSKKNLEKSQQGGEREGDSEADLGDYKFKEGIDEDLRGGKGTFKEALDKAFEKTGTPKEDFEVTKWGRDQYGKSHPVELRAPNGAEVSVDIGHPVERGAPTADHVGR